MWYSKLLYEFETTLNNYSIEIDDVLKLSETSTKYCESMLTSLRKEFFKSIKTEEFNEIAFFKNVKPLFVSRLIYFINVYNIEANCPNGSIKFKRKYIQLELAKIKNYFDSNLDFYRYYRTGSTYLDHKYFVRGKQDIRLKLDTYVFETDPDFSTSHDFKISTILANDLLQVYLENEMNKLDFNTNFKANTDLQKNSIFWSGSKVGLIELMYALHSSGQLNNGQADIANIAKFFESTFGLDLGNYYRVYLEIKIRQNPTKFLDYLTTSLQKRIEDEEK